MWGLHEVPSHAGDFLKFCGHSEGLHRLYVVHQQKINPVKFPAWYTYWPSPSLQKCPYVIWRRPYLQKCAGSRAFLFMYLETLSEGALPPGSPHRAPIERGFFPRAFFYLSLKVPCKGACLQVFPTESPTSHICVPRETKILILVPQSPASVLASVPAPPVNRTSRWTSAGVCGPQTQPSLGREMAV